MLTIHHLDNSRSERIVWLLEELGLPYQQQKAMALDYLGTIVNLNAQTMAFSDTFIVVGAVALIALVPAAMLSRSQRRARRLAFS